MSIDYTFLIDREASIFQRDGALPNKIINESGEIVDTQYYTTSKRIPCGNDILLNAVCVKNALRAAFYDNSENFISYQDVNEHEYAIIPNNAVYIRVTALTIKFADVSINVYGILHPIYGDAATIEYAKEGSEQFFRKKLTGDFTLCKNEYQYVATKPFETEFCVKVLMSNDDGILVPYINAVFSKSDCAINDIDKTIKVSFRESDQYTKILANMDREFDLTKLNIAKNNVVLRKRPMLQIYAAGESIISCFYDRHTFEQEITAISDYAELNRYHFAANPMLYNVDISQSSVQGANGRYYGKLERLDSTNPYTISGNFVKMGEYDGWSMRVSMRLLSATSWNVDITLSNYNEGVQYYGNIDASGGIYSITLRERAGTGSLRSCLAQFTFALIYMRYICDVNSYRGQNTYPIEEGDPVYDNRNYKRCIGWQMGVIHVSEMFSDSETEYGIAPNGKYYLPPDIRGRYYPIGRSQWGSISLWYEGNEYTEQFDREAVGRVSQRDFYKIGSTIKALLREIDPTITHEENATYSIFLYGDDPINPQKKHDLLITPKGNVIAGEYQTPVMKSSIKLSDILTMLRNTFQLYWHIEDGKLRIEHIRYYERGGDYYNEPVIGIDLTQMRSRNGMPWATDSDEYTYNKADMPSRYTFSWMDDVTESFKGSAIIINSKNTDEGRQEEVSIPNFTTDIDFILLSPESISNDGYVLIDAEAVNGIILPDTPYSEGSIAQGDRVLAQPLKAIDTILNEKQAILSYLLAGTGIAQVAYMSGNEVISYDNRVLQPSEETRQITITIPNECDNITMLCSGNITFKAYSLESSIVKQTTFDTILAHGEEYRMQNGVLSMMYLQPNYWRYAMPASSLTINNEQYEAISIARNKTSTITYPTINDPQERQLIRTNIGDGMIAKISINLSSRSTQTTLLYETE